MSGRKRKSKRDASPSRPSMRWRQQSGAMAPVPDADAPATLRRFLKLFGGVALSIGVLVLIVFAASPEMRERRVHARRVAEWAAYRETRCRLLTTEHRRLRADDRVQTVPVRLWACAGDVVFEEIEGELPRVAPRPTSSVPDLPLGHLIPVGEI